MLTRNVLSNEKVGMEIDMTLLSENDTIALLFSENSGLVLQSEVDLTNHFGEYKIECFQIGKVTPTGKLTFQNNNDQLNLDVASIVIYGFPPLQHLMQSKIIAQKKGSLIIK